MSIDLTQVTDLEFDGFDPKDAPDFSDVFVTSATYMGREMTDDELEELNDDHSDFVHEKFESHLY